VTSERAHCIVIGAGAVGACCAWHLVERGFEVTLVDREAPGQATSYGNAACISPSHVVPFSYPGVWKKIPGWLLDELGPLTIRWRDLPAVAPWLWRFWRAGSEEGVRRCAEAQGALMHTVQEDYRALLERAGIAHFLESRGLIVIYDHPDQFAKDRWIYDLQEEMGFPWEFVGPQELKIMAPALHLDGGVALYEPTWTHTVDPGRMTAGIARAATDAGATWVQDEVREARADDAGVRVGLASGRSLAGDRLVIAAGPWSNRLAEQLDQAVPMTAKRGYHAMLGEPGVELDYPVMSGSRAFVMTPLADGLRLAGTAEFARLDAEPNYRRAQVLVEHARHYFPDLRADRFDEWMGQRPMMADSVPIISPSPSRRNVFYAFGHGHYGLTQGPTTGRLIADLVQGREPPIDLAPYRFDRFP